MERLFEKFCDPNERLNKTCSQCGSNQISFLFYGLSWDEELQPLFDSGEILHLGCLVGKNNLLCKNCEFSWSSLQTSE